MSVAFFSDTPNVTRDLVERVSGFVNEHLGGSPPDGSLVHADGPTDGGGWWSFELFESEAQFTRFNEGILTPAFVQAGMNPPAFRRLEVAWDSTQVPG